MRFGLFFALLVFGIAATLAAPENNVPDVSQIERELLKKLSSACEGRKPYSCTKLKLLTFTDKILQKYTIQISDDVVLTRSQDAPAIPAFVQSSPRDLEDAQDDDSKFWTLITGKARSFLQSRELRWKVIPETDLVISTGRDGGNVNFKLSVDTARAVETARHKIKGFFFAGVGLAILKFFGLVALVLKAVFVSKLALAAAVFMSRWFWYQPHVTYEVVSHPHVVSHTSGHGDIHSTSFSGHDSFAGSVGFGHSRSGQADHLAYSAHVPK